MSYSFSVNAATAAEAKQKVSEAFDQVVVSQPYHAKDKDAAVAAASAFIDMLDTSSDGMDVYVNMSGSLGWSNSGDGEANKFTASGVNVGAWLQKNKEEVQPPTQAVEPPIGD